MSSNLSLLVPMNVTAFCVSKRDLVAGSKFGKIAAEFQNLETRPYLGSSVIPKPFEEEPALPGVHLHWALPDALTLSDPGAGNGFRQVPNRFLVVRLAAITRNPGEAPVELEKKAWVVESDYLWKDEEKSVREQDARNALSRAVPVKYVAGNNPDLDNARIFAYQGRVLPLEAWQNSPSTNPERFTALGYGTEAYAAAYPHCRNVFGFFDPIYDPGSARDGLGPQHQYLSYLVVGWYSNAGWDPATLLQNSKTFSKILNSKMKDPKKRAQGATTENFTAHAFSDAFKADYHWSYNWSDPTDPPGVTTNRPVTLKQPAQTLFVGQLTTLEWKPAQTYLTANADPVSVALGTTTSEALSAMIASTKGPGKAAAFESLLNDIQYDLLRDYASAAGQANREDALHLRDFTPVSAGKQMAKGPSFFVPNDFRNIDSLLNILFNDSNALKPPISPSTRAITQFIWQRIPLPLQYSLHETRTPSRNKIVALVQAFNAILTGPSIYDPIRFKGVALRPETQLLIPQNPTGDQLIRLNRLLLADAYPAEIGASENAFGCIWLIKPAGSKESTARSGILADAAAASETILPDDLGNALVALNRSQSSCDEMAEALTTRRGQLFADWTKYISSRNDEDARKYLEKEMESLTLLVREHKAQEAARDHAVDALKGLLRDPKHAAQNQGASAAAKPKYELDAVTAPRYYQPNDPVILLSGVDPSTRYGSDGRLDQEKMGNLNCRLSDEITSAGDLADLAQDKRSQLNQLCAKADWAGILPPSVPHRDDLIALCVEASLLNPWTAKFLAGVDLLGLQNDYIQNRNPRNFKGVPPSPIGFTAYAQPWIPLILQWEVAYSPFQPISGPANTRTSYPETWGLEQFELSQSSPEITYKGANPGFPALGATSYQGTATLTHNVQLNLIAQIKRYLKDHPQNEQEDDPEVKELKRALEEVSKNPLMLMAQSMEGFHQQLLMRDPSLQMHVVAPPPPRSRQDQSLKQKYLETLNLGAAVSRAVGDQCDAACLQDARQFNPLRAGILKITRLRVLDAFGQIRDLIQSDQHGGVIQPSQVVVSSRLNKAPREWNETGAVLPLRFAQPARLSFRYRAASVAAAPQRSAPGSRLEMNSNLASSPIFGWILYNRFDHALAIYDEEGRPIGSFNLLGPPWQETPGANRGVANPLLLEFIQYLGGQVPPNREDLDYPRFRGFLTKLIDTIDHVATGIEPEGYKQDQGLAMLIGHPLALVVADLHLDLYGTMPGKEGLPGLPAIDQSREAFDAVKTAHAYVEQDRRSADFARVRFPVRLGDDAKFHDGLVGYFIKSQDAPATYRTFYAASAASDGNPDVRTPPLTGSASLSLAPADSQPKTVVMLVDPRAAVHASVGLLPVKSIALPPAHYADALKRIDATFLVAPILGGADGIALPVPNVAGHAWSWITRQADERFGIPMRRWSTQGFVVSPNPRAAFSPAPLRIHEGWLHLYPVQTATDAATSKPQTAPTPFDILVTPGLQGDLALTADTARLHGVKITMAETDDGRRFISFWDDPKEYVTWRTKLPVGAWTFKIGKQLSGLSSADDVDSQVELVVRKAGSADVVTSSRALLPRGTQAITTFGLANDLAAEYELRVNLLRGALNLESIGIGPAQVVQQSALILSAKTASLVNTSTVAISLQVQPDGHDYLEFSPKAGALAAYAYWTAAIPAVHSPNIGVEICYSTQDVGVWIVLEAYNLNDEAVHSELRLKCAATGALTAFQTLRTIWPDPTLQIPKAGLYQIRVRTEDYPTDETLHIQWVKLIVPQELAAP